MRALLVLAHPLSDSLCAHLAQQAQSALEAQGVEVDRLDLYALGFRPELTAEERRTYNAPAPDAEIAALQQRLAAVDMLVLVFPTWWFSLPAMLKGWFERVWTPHFAFAPGTPIRPLLRGLKSVLVVTTLGSPWWVDRLVMRQPVRRVLRTGLILPCAPRARFRMLSLHGAEQLDPPAVEKFSARIRQAISKL